MEAAHEARVGVSGPRCPFCHETITPRVEKLACDACMAWHHAACWDEAGGTCSSCGASLVSGSDRAEPLASAPASPAHEEPPRVAAPSGPGCAGGRYCPNPGQQHWLSWRSLCPTHARRLHGMLLVALGLPAWALGGAYWLLCLAVYLWGHGISFAELALVGILVLLGGVIPLQGWWMRQDALQRARAERQAAWRRQQRAGP